MSVSRKSTLDLTTVMHVGLFNRILSQLVNLKQDAIAMSSDNQEYVLSRFKIHSLFHHALGILKLVWIPLV